MPINPNLLLQYLSGAGSALAQGQPIAPALGQITQQNITAQSYAGLLQRILGGGGKMTLDKDKFNLTGTPDLLSPQDTPQLPGDQLIPGGGAPVVSPVTAAPIPTQTGAGAGAGLGGNLGFLQALLNPQ